MSGGIGVVLAFAAAYFEWVARNGKTALWVAAAVAFFIAGYRAWLQERRKLEAERNQNSRRDFVTDQLKDLINDHKRIDIVLDTSDANVVNMAVHLIGTQIDHSVRAQKLLERYIDIEILAGYEGYPSGTDRSLWDFDKIRPVLEDIHRRIVEGEIQIKPFAKPDPSVVIAETDQK
jgi:hypothetical protein